MAKDPKYLKWVRQLPCEMAGHGDCYGSPHAHHATGGKGLGTKNHDHQTLSLCERHHSARHSLSGPFKGWNKARIKEWERECYERTRRLYLGLGSDDPLDG